MTIPLRLLDRAPKRRLASAASSVQIDLSSGCGNGL
jgi:hypothetical protein